jgi:hypothetical protein
MKTLDTATVVGWVLLIFMMTLCLAPLYMAYRRPKAQPAKPSTPPPAPDTSRIQIALLAAALNASRVAEQKACEERDAWKDRALATESSSDGTKIAALEKALRAANKARFDANAEALSTRQQRDVWRDRARAAETRFVAQEPTEQQGRAGQAIQAAARATRVGVPP